MKKLLLTIGLCAAATFSTFAQFPIATNTTLGGVHLLSTNRASIYSIELTSDKSVTVSLFDQDTLDAPYYGTNSVNAAYTISLRYPTNYVTSYIGQNGITNWYTNAGIYTYSSPVAANTNALTPGGVFVVGAGTYAVYNTDLLFTRGIVMVSTTNVSAVVNYRSGQ